MKYTLSMGRQVRSFAAVLVLCTGGSIAHASDTYSGGMLTCPTVIIGAGTYTDMVVTPASIVKIAGGTAIGTVDYYTPSNNQLFIPKVLVGATTYTNVTITIASLVSVASVTGVDTFSGGTLFVPTVFDTRGPTYNTGTVTIRNIISTGGGRMPANVRDVLDFANLTLTIAAIDFNGKVYTNAVIGIENINVTGTGIPVPSVVGETPAVADLAISAIGLAPGTVTLQHSGTVPDGDILGQNPLAGSFALSGASVNLTVSSGTAPPPPETVLYSFDGPTSNKSGLNPEFLMQAPNGNFYGTAPLGGASSNGTVFELSSGGTESLLYAFPVPESGTFSPNGLIWDASGSLLYGTTASGGQQFMGGSGGGSLFSLTTAGVEKQVYAFCGCIDNLGFFEGIQPNGLILSGGNFYGTDFTNGQDNFGTVFYVQPNGNGGVLHYFNSTATDGEGPVGNLIPVISNNETTFYGVTQAGGTHGKVNDALVGGTLFSVNSSSGVESVIYNFGASGTDAQVPAGGLTLAGGNFYGITLFGGASGNGAIYRVTPAGKETVLYSFPTAEAAPNSLDIGPMVLATDGNLYGVTGQGGSVGRGTLFRMTTSGTYTLLYSFDASVAGDAIMPSYLIQGADGNLYGVSVEGGTNGTGTIFKYVLTAP